MSSLGRDAGKLGGDATGMLPPDKSLGEFAHLGHNFGVYRPARMGLRNALAAGKMRNPLQMQQSAAPWSARRPLSASSTSRPSSRAQSAGRVRPEASNRSAATAAAVQLTSDVNSPRRKHMDRGPVMLQPQRIELPAYLNTPPRRQDAAPVTPEERTTAIRRIQDLELLTFACKRAAKVREEGRAHFSLAVLKDNIRQYGKAIECYNQFLKICMDCNDGQGCALAYHCIAVNYQLMGGGESALGPDNHAGAGNAAATSFPVSMMSPSGARAVADKAAAVMGSPIKPDLLRKAIFYHNKHRENADSVGKFVAHLNMGLAYALLSEKEASTVNHQYALRYALQLNSLEGQSLAIGSLSFSAGMYDNDPEKMRQLVERYLELSGTLKQQRNQASAFKKLGILASQQGDSEQSISYFAQAIESAREQGDVRTEKDCAVRLGIATGQAKMAEHLSDILQRAVVTGNTHEG